MMSSDILLMKIGNTQTIVKNKNLDLLYSCSTNEIKDKHLCNQFLLKISASQPKAIVVASVVPSVQKNILALSPSLPSLKNKQKIKFVWVDRHWKSDVVLTEDIKDIGSDLLCNIQASFYLSSVSGWKLVFDLGTTLSIILLKNQKIYGGAFYTGVHTAQKSLLHNTSLPHFPLDKPSMTWGINTATCLNTGFFHSYCAILQYWYDQAKKLIQDDSFYCFATGGDAVFFEDFWDDHHIHYQPNLIFQGIQILFSMNFDSL